MSTTTNNSVKKIKTPDEWAVKFVENAGKLIDNLMLVLPPVENIVLRIVRITMCEKLEKHEVINQFIKHSKNFWEEIDTDNEQFFLNPDHANKIFGDLPLDKVLDFKKYWLELNEDNRKVIRQYFKRFVFIAREYEIVISKKKTD